MAAGSPLLFSSFCRLRSSPIRVRYSASTSCLMSLTTSSTLVSLTLSLRHSVWLLSSLVGRQLTPQPNKRKRKQLFFTNSADVDPTLLSSIVHKLSGAEHSFPPKRLLLPTTLDLCDHPLLCSQLVINSGAAGLLQAHPTLCAGPTTVLEIGVGRRAAAACTLYLYHVHVPAASRPHLVTLLPAAQAPVTLHTKHGILAFDTPHRQ